MSSTYTATYTTSSKSLYEGPLWEEQAALEESMVTVGRERFYAQIEKAKQRGEESGTGYGARLVKTLIEPMSGAIRAFLDEALSGKAGRRHIAVAYMQLVEPEVLAYLTLKTVLDTLNERQMVQTVATRLGAAIQDEVWVSAYKEANATEFKTTMRHIEKATSRRHKQRVARIMAKRVGVEINWPESDRLHLGRKLIELLQTSTGLVEEKMVVVGKNDTRLFLFATDATMAWIDRANERMEILTPAYVPTLIPPRPWTAATGGGYWTGIVRPLPLVKTRNRAYLEELNEVAPQAVYDAVNTMQATPWRINKPVLEVLRALWAGTAPVKGLPARDKIELPVKPADIAENADARKAWKRLAAPIHEANEKAKSKRIALLKTLEVARQFEDREAIYFPYQLDFRGRVYAVPMFLNPQGPDYTKALLTFAEGKPLGDGTGPGWLAIHGANSYGFDKATLEDRIAFIEERTPQILEAAADPLGEGYDFWTKADSPWCFLAFCFEWAGFQAEGPSYVSSLPIALDGSCNGLQHYSAALRDPEGGSAVNLIPSEKPKDIYATVAERALWYVKGFARLDGSAIGTHPQHDVLLARWAAAGIDPEDMATRWLRFGISRGITKRAVMTMPYGSTMKGCRDFIREAVNKELNEKGKANEFQVEGEPTNGVQAAASWLLPIVWQAIGDVVKAARAGMGWLKECAKLASAENLPIMWTTPDGFPVQQAYMDTKARKVKTHIDGSVVYLTLREELPTVNAVEQGNGIAPNWVHSMDATAMRMFVNLAAANGVTDFALIHDSFGSVAADVDMISACLRKAFVGLYTEQCPLSMFRVDIGMMLSDEGLADLPPVPAKGDLDLSLVEQSAFFFA